MEEIQIMESIYLPTQKKPWHPRFPGMSQDPMQQLFLGYQYPIQNSWNAPMPWKTWSPHPNQNHHVQNWRVFSHGNQIY